MALLLRKINGPNVVWNSVEVLDVWLAEARLEADHQASKRVERVTWALVFATAALTVATVGLIFASLRGAS